MDKELVKLMFLRARDQYESAAHWAILAVVIAAIFHLLTFSRYIAINKELETVQKAANDLKQLEGVAWSGQPGAKAPCNCGVLRGAGEVLRVGAPPYRAKFATFLKLRRELGERCPGAEYFDLRFGGRIYAREPETASVVASSAATAVAAPVAGAVARND